MTSSSVPDSFSMDELSNMLENAPQEEDLHTANQSKELSPEDIERIAQEAIDYASERAPGPLVHKVMAMAIITRMIEWHTHMGVDMFDNDNQMSGVCWLRDAGKFQSMMNSLVNISVGDDDFTCDQDD